MSSLMDETLTHNSCRCQRRAKVTGPKQLHQSKIELGDTAPCYTTTHSQSYSGKSSDGRPLIFHLKAPSFPSQHRTGLDLSTDTDPLQPQREDVQEPERITARTDLMEDTWARHCSGKDVRDVTNPQGPAEYRTTHRTEHTVPVTDGSPQLAGGRPTQWHQHNILTGEQRQTAGPGVPSRRSRDRLLWAARRWETDCCSLRLY